MLASTGKKEVPFCDVLTKSLSPEQVTPAWCDVCSKYQPTKQSRKISQLPPILALNCGMDSQSVSLIAHVCPCLITNQIKQPGQGLLANTNGHPGAESAGDGASKQRRHCSSRQRSSDIIQAMPIRRQVHPSGVQI
jgi:Ubiquitin carboxyl-terminal hydrolase